MTKIAKRQYNVKSGETVTVGVQSSGTAVVNYDLDGQEGVLAEGQPLSIPVTTSTRVLALLFTFTNNSGGKCAVAIQSDKGGSDTDNVEQGAFGVPATETTYRFQL